MNLLSTGVTADFLTGVVLTIIALEIITFIILLVVSFSEPFKKMQALYKADLLKNNQHSSRQNEKDNQSDNLNNE